MDYLENTQHLIELPGLVNVAISFLGATVFVLLAVFLAHTAAWLGRQTFLYKRKQPVHGWNMRFYPAITLLILTIVGLMIFLARYKATL